jgi:hypothetical protein
VYPQTCRVPEGYTVLDRHWDDLKRVAGAVPFASALLARNWWALASVIALLVVAGCWMAYYTDAEEFWSPIFAWKRPRVRRRRPRSKPP